MELAAKVIDHGGKAAKVAEALAGGASIKSSRVADDFAQLVLKCQVVYAKETQDWDPCVKPLEDAFSLAQGESVRTRIQENIRIVRDNADQAKIDELYRSVGSYVWNAIEEVKKNPAQGLERAKYIVDHSAEYIAAATALWGRVLTFNHLEFADRLASIIHACLVCYYNETQDFCRCEPLIESALQVARSEEIKQRIDESRKILYENRTGIRSECFCKDVQSMLDDVQNQVAKNPGKAICYAEMIATRAADIVAQGKRFMTTSQLAELTESMAVAIEKCLVQINIDVSRCAAILELANQTIDSDRIRDMLPDDVSEELQYLLVGVRDEYSFQKALLRDAVCIWRKSRLCNNKCIVCGCSVDDVSTCYLARSRVDEFAEYTFAIIDVLVPRCQKCAMSDDGEIQKLRSELSQIEARIRSLRGRAFCFNRAEKINEQRKRGDEIGRMLRSIADRYESYPLARDAGILYRKMKYQRKGPVGKRCPLDEDRLANMRCRAHVVFW